MDFKKIKTIHFVGLKGVAMTALAIVAKEMDKEISGSDTEEEFPTDATLKRFGIIPLSGFSRESVHNKDLVIYTGAHQGRQNAEVIEAEKLHIPTLAHGRALGLFMQGKRVLSIAGSHGKTTTSAMIAHVLSEAGLDPSFAVGCGEISSLKTSGHAGSGEYFVAEADEYVTDPVSDPTPRFMWQEPEVLLITNIDFDHPDVYTNLAQVQSAFVKFTQKVKSNGSVIVNIDDQNTVEILDQVKSPIITYGIGEKANYRIVNIKVINQATQFELEHEGKNLGTFTLCIPGEHNVLNATGAIGLLSQLGIDAQTISRNLATFVGTKRRFEKIGEKNSKLLYDDYAHHPAEITATIKAARSWFPDKRLVVVFQPHTYSRTQALLTDFAHSLSQADQVVTTEIYPSAREKVIPDVSGQLLADRIRRTQSAVHFAPNKTDVLQYLHSHTQSGDIIMTMGAGDIYSWLPHILDSL